MLWFDRKMLSLQIIPFEYNNNNINGNVDVGSGAANLSIALYLNDWSKVVSFLYLHNKKRTD
jgi:hypothetical protein